MATTAAPICGKANISKLTAPLRAKAAVVPAQNTPARTCATVTRTNIHTMLAFSVSELTIQYVYLLSGARKMSPRAYRSAAREDAAERNRLRIVAAAGKLLRAKGAAGFSLDAVARKAHVTRLTVYNQFGSRRRLLEAVFDDHAARGGLG